MNEVNEMRRKLSKWIVPVVVAVTLPAHAQTSDSIALDPPGTAPGRPPAEDKKATD